MEPPRRPGPRFGPRPPTAPQATPVLGGIRPERTSSEPWEPLNCIVDAAGRPGVLANDGKISSDRARVEEDDATGAATHDHAAGDLAEASGDSIRGGCAGAGSDGCMAAGANGAVVDRSSSRNVTGASLANHMYASGAEAKRAAIHKEDADACSICTAPPTPEVSTSKQARVPRPTTASQPEEPRPGEQGRDGPLGMPPTTAAIAAGSVSQHMAGSDEEKEQQARTLPRSRESSCWAMLPSSEARRRMEVRGVMTATTKREPTAPGVGGISTREQAEEGRYRPSTLATPRPQVDDHGRAEQDQGRAMPDGRAGGDDRDKHASVRGRGSGEGGEAPTRRERNQRNEKAPLCSSSTHRCHRTARGEAGAQEGPVRLQRSAYTAKCGCHLPDSAVERARTRPDLGG